MAQNIPLKFLDWIDVSKIDWWHMADNPKAVHMLEPNHSNTDVVWKRLFTKPPRVIYTTDSMVLYERHILNWPALCTNPNCIWVIEKYMRPDIHPFSYSGCWQNLHCNENAVHLLKRHPEKIYWKMLCENTSPEAIRMLEENPDRISWSKLYSNPAAMHLLEAKMKDDPSSINWEELSGNPHPKAIEILEKNPDAIYLPYLCCNTNAIHLIERYKDDIIYYSRNEPDEDLLCYLSANDGPGIIEFLEKNPEMINWGGLSKNPNAIHLLEKNQDKINYRFFSKNPAIFQYDYGQMMRNHMELKEELIRVAMSPKRIEQWLLSADDVDPDML